VPISQPGNGGEIPSSQLFLRIFANTFDRKLLFFTSPNDIGSCTSENVFADGSEKFLFILTSITISFDYHLQMRFNTI